MKIIENAVKYMGQSGIIAPNQSEIKIRGGLFTKKSNKRILVTLAKVDDTKSWEWLEGVFASNLKDFGFPSREISYTYGPLG